MSKRNERYLRREQLSGARAKDRIETGKENEGKSVVSETKSATYHGVFQGVKGREITVNVRQINMPKKSHKTKQTPRFPLLKRGSKKERLVDIKRRVLALKFGYIWERKTFGRVSPLKARRHYERKLLQKSVWQWEDIWWNGRNEWKLNIRADYHNRFRLWLKAWRAWRSFITVKKMKKMKLNLAQAKANHAQLTKCVACWRTYISSRRKKKQFYLKAQEQGKVLAKRRTFNRWKNLLAFKKDLLSMEEQALHFWARNLFYKVWGYWVLNYNVTQERKRKFAFAVQFYNRRLAFKVFGSLKVYCIHRKIKQLRLRSSQRYYRLQSLRRWFLKWKVSWTRKRELTRFEGTILGKGEEAKKRRIFLAWKRYISLCRRRQQNDIMAWNHFKKSLKRKCLNTLQKRVSNQKLKNSWKIEAFRFYTISLVRKMWNSWLRKCENSEELRLMTLNSFVRNHYRKALLKRMMKEWRLYRELRKQKKADNRKADEMARKILLPRCFRRLEAFVEMMKERQRTQEKAKEFRRECLLAKTYYHWWRSYQQELDVQMLYRMAVISYDEKVKRHFFKVWLVKVRWRLRETSLLVRGDTHYEWQLKKKYLAKWNEFIRYISRSARRLEMAVRHQNTKLLLTSWVQWTKYICKKRTKWKRVAIADLSFHLRILQKTLSAWRIYSSSMKKVKSYAEERNNVHEKMTVSMLFQRWRKHARYLKEVKEGVYKSFQHWKVKTERKVFVAWRIFAAEHFWRKQNSLSKIATAQKTLEQVKLRRYFRFWRRIYSQKVTADNLLMRAAEHWKRRTLKKSIDIWLNYRFLSYRKLVLQQQCMWYHNRRIIASFLKIWKTNFHLRVNLTKKSNVALWMWSFSLQRKVFAAWSQYANDKKKRKRSVNEAFERRRHWLYSLGVTQWIKFATYSIAEREKIAASRHIRLSENVQRCVQRCAVHWRRLTIERNRYKRNQITRPLRSSARSTNTFISGPLNIVDIEEQSSQNVNKIEVAIPQVAKRPKPRRPEYLRESFSFSEIFADQSAVSMKCTDDIEAFPREWRSDLKPVTPPPRLQKPNSFTQSAVIPQSATSKKSLQERHGLLANVTSRNNHQLLPPSCFVSRNGSEENKHGNGLGRTRDNSSGFEHPKDVPENTTVDHSLPYEKIRNDSKSHNSDSHYRDTMPDFLCDKDSQQSIVQLRNRMLKYYSVNMELRDLRQRLQCLREWTKEPKQGEEQLSEEESLLVHELIKKLSDDVKILSRDLDASYGTITNDLQQFLDKIT